MLNIEKEYKKTILKNILNSSNTNLDYYEKERFIDNFIDDYGKLPIDTLLFEFGYSLSNYERNRSHNEVLNGNFKGYVISGKKCFTQIDNVEMLINEKDFDLDNQDCLENLFSFLEK